MRISLRSALRFLALAFLVMSVVGAGCGGGDGISLKVGNKAPDFSLPTPDGRLVSLAGLRGKPVLVTFWATWCEPCKKEMPHFQAAYEKYGKGSGLTVLAVNFGEPDGGTKTLTFFKEQGLTFPAVLDAGQKVAQEKYGVFGLPTSYMIDRNGVIRFVKIGPFLTLEELEQTLTLIGVKGG